MAGHGNRAILAAAGANLGIAIGKFVGFLLTGSASLLAESVHSIADTGNQGLLLLGTRKSLRPPNELHEFGYGRERYFWGFVVAVVLFTLGSAFAIYEGIEKIREPHELESAGIAIGLLSFAVVLEAFSFRTAIQEANQVRQGLSWFAFIRRAKSPELPVVLIEDFGALIGLAIALSAVIISSVTDNPHWDGYGTLSIGILLGVLAIILAIEMRSLLLGEAATPEMLARIRSACASDVDCHRVIHLRTQHLGPDELLVGLKIELDPSLDAPGVADAINRIETTVRTEVPEARYLFIEPDRYVAP